MYFIFGFFILVAFFFVILGHCRSRTIRRKICELSCCEKGELLNELIEPFGFSYDPCQDLFSSRQDAWQRDHGYCTLFDLSAPHVQMIFDCEPIYFDYEGRTWLIELWKGQYGINTGAEIGLYHADSLVSPSDYATTLFHTVKDEEMLDLSMELWKEETFLFRNHQRHWWLTGFRMGCFSHPADLTLKASITFSDCEMMDAFLQAVIDRGYPRHTYRINCTTVTLLFRHPYFGQPCQRAPFSCSFSQWKNKRFCRLYLCVTQPFCNSADRLLYLFYFLPFAFRRTVQVCKPRRYKTHKNKRHKSKAGQNRHPNGGAGKCCTCHPRR